MAHYDPKIIAAMADRLYSNAASIVAAYAFIGAVIGLAIGFAIGVTLLHSAVAAMYGALIVGFLAGAIGFANGQKAALVMRFQAQQALVLAEIERNTRGRG